jgi:PEP-CTERM motif
MLIRHLIATLSIAVSAGAAQAALQATTLDFNDRGASTVGTSMGSYAGFDWGSQWYYMTTTANPADTFLAMGTVTGNIIMRSDRADFHFDGADFWSRRGLDAIGDFSFVLYHDGITVYNGDLEPKNAGRNRFTGEHQLFKANYSGPIDGMAFFFDNDDYDHLAMDNFQFRIDAAPVPEPAAAGLLALGLAGLAAAVRRRSGH